MKKDTVSLRDIARICNVSVSTVSKALNDRADIGFQKKDEIRKVAKQLNYNYGHLVSAQQKKKTRNIGVLFTEETGTSLMHEHFAKILNSFKDTVEERGYFISFLHANDSAQRMSYIEQCEAMNFDGVLILCANYHRAETQHLIDCKVPIVVIDHSLARHTNIASNQYHDMRRLMQLIHYRGHRKIAYIHGPNNEVTEGRVNAYRDFMQEHGLPIPREYVYTCPYRDFERGSALTKAVLALTNRPTCILYPDDFTAIGGLNMMQEAGLSIPRDISIAGYDGINLVHIVRPRLTTIRQDTTSMGIQAGNQLIKRIERPQDAVDGETVVVDGMLEPGESVAVVNGP